VIIKCATVLALAVASPAFAAEEKLLLQDLIPQGVDTTYAAALSSATCHALSNRKGLDLLCGDDLRALIQWSQVATSLDACKDDACLGAAARGLDAQLVVSGTVGKIGDGYVLSLSLLDAKAGRVRGRSEVKAASLEALHAQVAEAVSALFTGGGASSKKK